MKRGNFFSSYEKYEFVPKNMGLWKLNFISSPLFCGHGINTFVCPHLIQRRSWFTPPAGGVPAPFFRPLCGWPIRETLCGDVMPRPPCFRSPAPSWRCNASHSDLWTRPIPLWMQRESMAAKVNGCSSQTGAPGVGGKQSDVPLSKKDMVTIFSFSDPLSPVLSCLSACLSLSFS